MRTWVLALAVGAVAGCAARDTVGEAAEPIINGTLDTTHQAVVAVAMQSGNQGGLCSGTIVKVDAATQIGWVLTAAHCFDIPPVAVFQGNDYAAASSLRYDVLDYHTDPQYQGTTGSPHDFAIVRIVGVDANTPTIPIVTPAQDTLTSGAAVVSVGYGRTTPISATPDDNSLRYRVSKTLNSATSTHFGYSLSTSGICQGDSGGPMLATIASAERLVGVHSYVTNDCLGDGYSGRVSIANTWIQQQLAAAAPSQSCDLCSGIASSGNNVCAQRTRACLANAECAALTDCINACTSSTCQTNCRNAHPLGLGPLYTATYCACNEACSSTCRGTPACTGVPACTYHASPATTCTTCHESKCCAEIRTCAANGTCYDCMKKDGAPTACARNAGYQGLLACSDSRCAVECAPTTDDGGTPGDTPDLGGEVPVMAEMPPASGCTMTARATHSDGAAAFVLAALCILAVARARRTPARHDAT